MLHHMHRLIATGGSSIHAVQSLTALLAVAVVATSAGDNRPC